MKICFIVAANYYVRKPLNELLTLSGVTFLSEEFLFFTPCHLGFQKT